MRRAFPFRALGPTLLILAVAWLDVSWALAQPPPVEGEAPAEEGDDAEPEDSDDTEPEEGEAPEPEDSDDTEPEAGEAPESEGEAPESEGEAEAGEGEEPAPEEGEDTDHWGGGADVDPDEDGEDFIDTGHDEVPPPDDPVEEEPVEEPAEEPVDEADAWPPPEGTGDAITEHRDRPDYDGLEEPGTTPEDALLWIPRILTGPLYLVTEFLIRRPIGWLVTELEQTDLLALAAEVFTFADNKIGIIPTAFFDFGFVPSFGVYFFWDEFIAEENRISAHGGTFGLDWLSAVITDRIQFDEDTTLQARFSAIRRPDYLFGGIGSQAQTAVQARFGMSQVDASLEFKRRIWNRSRVRALGGYRSATFHNEGYLGNPSIGEFLASQGRGLPEGFTTGYSAFRLELEGWFDTREVSARPTAGVAVHGFANAHGAFEGLGDGFDGWLHYGGGLGGFTDILGDDRILALQADLQVISALDPNRVPFFELIDLGGLGPLAGFLPGQIRGRSTLAVTAAYEWPVWVFLNGRIHFAVGNAFGEHFSDFEAEDLRMSFGIGLAPTLGGDLPFEIAFAFGTETFRNGADITSFRFVVGARNGL